MMKPSRKSGLSRRLIFSFFMSLFMLSASSNGVAQPAARGQVSVPDILEPWIDWVLDDDEVNPCPYLAGSGEETICAWASELEITLGDSTGSFAQRWKTFDDEWVPLPGDEDHWPQDVTLNGKSAPVINLEGFPHVSLKPGNHALTGRFFWDSIPESFQIPPETGVLSLTVRGRAIPFPKRDGNGRLWLEEEEVVGEGGEEYVDVKIYRRLMDDIPFEVTTFVELNVAGKTREIHIPKALLPGFVPTSLTSDLPARLEKDHSLTLQIRTGVWQIRLFARHEGPVSELSLTKGEGEEETEEIWVFEAVNALRMVSVEGVPTVDPQQTTLPEEWKRLPAYRMRPGDTIRFVEQQRGDSNPAPDQLALTRELWLDFDGGGYTVNDRVSGTMNRSWRLEMNRPFHLGRLSVGGEDQFITRLPDQERNGIEIREGTLDVTADSRLDSRGGGIPAVGWNHDVQSLGVTLHLPPGWRIFAATGADHVPETWINQWSLLEIFLVLILSLSFAKLWGLRWGVISLVTLALSFQEPDSPRWIWPVLLAGVALMRVIRIRWIVFSLKVYRIGVLILLLISSIPFMVDQVRMALYPSLERPGNILEQWSSPSYEGGLMDRRMMKAAPQAPPMPEAIPEGEVEEVPSEEKGPVPQENRMQQAFTSVSKGEAYQQNLLYRLKQVPGAKVQTGPGLPSWSWREVEVTWSGPVEKGQELRFFLIPPWLHLVFSFLRVLLLALLILCVFGFPGKFWPPFFRKYLIPSTLSSLLLFISLIPSPALAQDNFPPPELLSELRERLTKKPDCHPNCASISRMKLEVTPQVLRARLDVAVEGDTAVPLPGSEKEWQPNRVIVDGNTFAGLNRGDDGTVWIQLPTGFHQIILEGLLPRTQTVQIPLPLKPYYVEATVAGWSLSGLHEDGQVDENLQLMRTERIALESAQEKDLPSQVLPPFVRVERILSLGLTWEAETRVVRLTPAGTAIVLEVPLLEGESVTTEGMRVEGGKVRVNLAPQAAEISWRSVLEIREKIALKAADSLSWVELWQIDAAPIWHVTVEGIPFIHREEGSGTWPPVWRPWPGEEVAIQISRPEGVEGQTVTLDHSLLLVKPGRRYTDATLTLSVRSSLGGQHILSIPGLTELKSVTINGTTQPIRPIEGKVTLPLTPGSQAIEVSWQEARGLSLGFKTPTADLGIPGVNAETKIELPSDRWILWLCGPRMGPAVLFWSFLIVVLLLSYGLGRVPLTPLRFLSWILLGLGLSQVSIWISVVVVAWLVALGARKSYPPQSKWSFDLVQLLLPCLTLMALLSIAYTIYQGLLGVPDMQIEGNGSTSTLLRWFDDQSSSLLSRSFVFSVPLFWFRIAMLAWALWLAIALISWLKWGWSCYSSSGLWRPIRTVVRTARS